MKQIIHCRNCGSRWEVIPNMMQPMWCVSCSSADFTHTQVEIEYSEAVSPSHYKGELEVWQMMIAVYGLQAYLNFCDLNAFKYRMRAGKKPGNDAAQDIAKAQWYERKAEELRNDNKDNR